MTESSLTTYLRSLEELTAGRNDADFYLWPRTPIYNYQNEIESNVGVSDLDPDDPRSRPASILRFIKALRSRDLIPADFSVLDVCCGDAVVIRQIKEKFPTSRCYGVDILKGKVQGHRAASRVGVKLFKVFIQDLFNRDPMNSFDLVVMLNTYRGWSSARLREHEKNLPRLAHDWLLRNGRYVIVTIRKSQIKELWHEGQKLSHLGPGEASSFMICVSNETVPLGWTLHYRDFFYENRSE